MLDTNNPLANFTQEGHQQFATSPAALTLIDGSNNDLITLFANDPGAAPGIELDLVVSLQVLNFTAVNADIGLRFSINDGQSLLATAACIVNGGRAGIGIPVGVNFSDPANYPVFVPAEWTLATALRLRRTCRQ